ncbi:plasmid recombination protein [Hoylesella pleuritidis]|nr:plasmid recombination protein [Hoylesella pleuritidis]
MALHHFGKENVVAAILHVDEETPHIHATVVPIVREERQKPRRKLRMARGSTKRRKTRCDFLPMMCFPKKLEEYQTTYAKQMSSFGLVRGVYGSEAKYCSNINYYKYVLKSTKEKKVQEAEFTAKIKELEAGKLRMKGTLYSLFGNSELDKAE